MKKVTLIFTAIILFSCEKQNEKLSALISKDSNFIQLIRTVEPVLMQVNVDRNYRPDTNWAISVHELAGKVHRKFPNATDNDLMQAVSVTTEMNMTGEQLKACQEQAEGTFVKSVFGCFAFAAIPVVGEGVAGGCEIGALVSYVGDMDKCRAAPNAK